MSDDKNKKEEDDKKRKATCKVLIEDENSDTGKQMELIFLPQEEKEEKEVNSETGSENQKKGEEKKKVLVTIATHLKIGLQFDGHEITGIVGCPKEEEKSEEESEINTEKQGEITQAAEMVYDEKVKDFTTEIIGWYILSVNDAYQHDDTEKIEKNIAKTYDENRETKIRIQQKKPERLLDADTTVWAQWRSGEDIRLYAGKIQRINPKGDYVIQFVDHEVRNNCPRNELLFRPEKDNAVFVKTRYSDENMNRIKKMRSMSREEIREWFKECGKDGKILWKTWNKKKWEEYGKLHGKKDPKHKRDTDEEPLDEDFFEMFVNDKIEDIIEKATKSTMDQISKENIQRKQEIQNQESPEIKLPAWFTEKGKKVEEIEKRKWEIYSKDFYIKRRKGEDIYQWDTEKWNLAFGNSEISLPHDFFDYMKELKEMGYKPEKEKRNIVDKFFGLLFGEADIFKSSIFCGKCTSNVDDNVE